MIAVLQRVSAASVSVDGEVVARIDDGLLALVGVHRDDGDDDLSLLADKIPNLRIFADEAGRMNRSLRDVGASLLLVSQFTLVADTRKGRRPAFVDAMAPEGAEPMLDGLGQRIREQGVDVATGVFGAAMSVKLVNEGPVTILLDSRQPRGGHR